MAPGKSRLSGAHLDQRDDTGMAATRGRDLARFAPTRGSRTRVARRVSLLGARAQRYGQPMTEETKKDGTDQTEGDRIVDLAQLDPVSYNRQRVGAATAMGVRVSTLDKLVASSALPSRKNASPPRRSRSSSSSRPRRKASPRNPAASRWQLRSIDTAKLLMVIAEEMIAGTFKSLPGHSQMQAAMLMAIARGLMDAARLRTKRTGRLKSHPSDKPDDCAASIS